jgi:hypothetical protein
MFFCCLNLFAQDNGKKGYELLLLEIKMYDSYLDLSDASKEMIKLAAEYEEQGDYDLAAAFLEEALNELKSPAQKDTNPVVSVSDYTFSGNIISGIDYNRQEFELGFEQSDSVLLDELSKPFVGFEIKYASADDLFRVENAFRYDQENLRNELFFNNTFKNSNYNLDTRLGGLLDRNFEYDDLSYYEAFAELGIKSNYNDPGWYWQFKNKSRLKKYKQSSLTIPDFFRNSFSSYVVRNFNYNNSMQLDYTMDLNESLKYRNNDFLEHNAGVSYQNVGLSALKIKLASRYRYFNFNYQLSDSAFENTSNTFSLDPNLVYDFNSSLSLNLDYNVDIKEFSIKTEQEPDYTYHYVNPSFVVHFTDLSSVYVGFVYENKKHVVQNNLVAQYIRDQDYHSSGFTAGFDYTTLNGTLLSINAEYRQRRYPNSQNDADFSIYSNRNILSLLIYGQIPLYKAISLNIIGSYDNDKDIDSDFNDTISSFYTMELLYAF